VTIVGRLLQVHHLNRRAPQLAGLLAITALLQFGAALGLASVAGFDEIHRIVDRFQWPWMFAILGSIGLSFAGYYYAYQGVYTVEDGDELSPPQMRAVVIAGFGGFFAHGGTVIDSYAIKATGAGERDAATRVATLAGMEHGVLALFGCPAAIVVLVLGLPAPPPDFTLPWSIIPIPGFLLAFWLAERFRDQLRRRRGWRRRVGIFLDSIHLTRELFRRPFANAAAPFSMILFWGAEVFAMWSGLAAFGYHMNVAQMIVGYSTGMVFTRRTGPFAGAGILMCILPATLYYSGAPFAVAVMGVLLYRFISLWVPLPFSLAGLPILREIGKKGVPHAEAKSEPPEHEPAVGHE